MMNITMSTVHVITTQYLMSEHSFDSISNRLAQAGKDTLQKKHITRLKGHINIDQLCDKENLPTDLPESWPYKEPLHNKSGLINYGDKIITVICQHTHKELLHSFRTIRRERRLPPTSKEICKRTQTGETNIGSTQTKYNMGTSNSCKPMYHKLLLDHARQWYRAAERVQEDQIYVKDQIHSNRSQTDRVQEQPIDRTRES